MSILKKRILIIFLILNISCSQSNSDDELETEEVSYLIVNDIRTNTGIDEITTGYLPFANKKMEYLLYFFLLVLIHYITIFLFK